MASEPTKVIVEPRELRRMFNDGGFWPRAQSGDLRERLVRESRPTPDVREPEGTRSQIIEYVNENEDRVAIVHQYLRSDGTLGASGLPDPKLVVIGGVAYGLAKAD